MTVYAVLTHDRASPAYPARIEPIGQWRDYRIDAGYQTHSLWTDLKAARGALKKLNESPRARP